MNFLDFLRQNPYPGRGIAVGRNRVGPNAKKGTADMVCRCAFHGVAGFPLKSYPVVRRP